MHAVPVRVPVRPCPEREEEVARIPAASFYRGIGLGVQDHRGIPDPMYAGLKEHDAVDRYVSEFEFRYNNRVKLGVDDAERTDNALKGAVGKRLTYRSTGGSRATQTSA
jgi:hypothetical protein